MTVFATPFLFLRTPGGNVEDLDRMRAAGFAGAVVNVGDHEPEEWTIVIHRAQAAGMWFGPWARTQGSDGGFSTDRLERLVDIASSWGSPVVVNSETELKGSGSELTTLIVDACSGLDAAVSMEWRPFDGVYWVPLGDAGVPVLPQLFPEAGPVDPVDCRDLWHAYGVRCVYPTFGTYGGRTPADYPLDAPFSLYTADDCGGNYAAWSPRSSSWAGCVDEPPEPEPGPDPPDPEPEPGPEPPDGGGEPMTGKGAAASADAAFDYWLASTARPADWREQNPGEWSALEDYRAAPAGTPAPTTIKTNTGRMLLELVEARRYAEGSHA